MASASSVFRHRLIKLKGDGSMRKLLAVYLVFATILIGSLTAIGQTIDLSSVSKLTREKQIAKQEKVDYIVATLASGPVEGALQKAGIRLSHNDAESLAGFATPKQLELLYSRCEFVNQTMALGAFRGWYIPIILGAIAVIVFIVLLILWGPDDFSV
jgi:hypothetical protein